MSKKEEKQEKEVNLSPYIDALGAVFQPAFDARHTTHWFSTDEIFQEIKQINPGADISKEDIHDAMLAAGYRYQQRPGALGCNFRWMLKARNI